MGRNERSGINIGPKFELIIGENEFERFEVDSEGGPVVGFVRDRNGNVRLVTLDHNIILDPEIKAFNGPVANRADEPVRLRYTPEEWVAFYSGVKDGEFQDLYDNPYQNLLKDSKQTDGPIFVILSQNWRPWMDAIQSGKYDVPKGQEESILDKFEKNKDQQLRRVSEILASTPYHQPQLNITYSPRLVSSGTLLGSEEIARRIAKASMGQNGKKEHGFRKLDRGRALQGKRN
jgi:hypothetical protein